MPVSLRSLRTSERTNFHQPAASSAYGEQFKQIGIPAVAAAAAQMKWSPLAEARLQAKLHREIPAILRDDADRD